MSKFSERRSRHCEIISIDEESRIVDTPGFSNLKFDFLMPNEVDLLFDEIAKYKRECKFQDCLHNTETGCAVKEHLDKIWNRFYRVDKSRSAGEGFGLGLSMVRFIVDIHGGSIAVKSKPGYGTTFTVSL